MANQNREWEGNNQSYSHWMQWLTVFALSHTSMWGQMNDCSLNISIQAYLEDAATVPPPSRKKCTRHHHWLLTTIHLSLWSGEIYVSTEHQTQIKTGTHVTKHSYFICGICPLNPGCMNWIGAIQMIGQKALLLELVGCEKIKGWEVRVRDKDDNDNFCKLTKEQAKLMMEGYESFYNDERDLAIVAMLQAKSILA
eukprot:scaffold68758_cov52-Attheya_sp.AAC.4